MLVSIIIKFFSFPLLSESLWCPESRWGKLLVEIKAPPGAGRGNGERAQERLLAPVPHPCVPVPAAAPLRALGAVGEPGACPRHHAEVRLAARGCRGAAETDLWSTRSQGRATPENLMSLLHGFHQSFLCKVLKILRRAERTARGNLISEYLEISCLNTSSSAASFACGLCWARFSLLLLITLIACLEKSYDNNFRRDEAAENLSQLLHFLPGYPQLWCHL